VMSNWQVPWADFSAVALLDASTTFPGVFDPVLLQHGSQTLPFFTDMGIVENDPSFAALQIVRQAAPAARIILVNLGTGDYAPDPSSSALTHWGELRWLTTIMPAVASGNVQVTVGGLRAEQAYLGAGRLAYYPIDIQLPQGSFYHPFNGSAQNLANIRSLGAKCVEQNQATLKELATILVRETD